MVRDYWSSIGDKKGPLMKFYSELEQSLTHEEKKKEVEIFCRLDYLEGKQWREKIKSIISIYNQHLPNTPEEDVFYDVILFVLLLSYGGFVREHYVSHAIRALHNYGKSRIFDVYRTCSSGDLPSKIDFVVYCSLNQKWATFGVSGDHTESYTFDACTHVFEGKANTDWLIEGLYVPTISSIEKGLMAAFEI